MITPGETENLQSRLNSIWEKYRIPIVLGFLSISLIVFSIILIVKSTQINQPIEFFQYSRTTGQSEKNTLGESSQSGIVAPGDSISVDIEGGIVKPGVYTMPPGARVDDLIKIAGGLRTDADSDLVARTINRASLLRDGGKIYIPIKGEDMTSHNLDPLLQRPGGPSQNRFQVGSVVGPQVNINTASEIELDSLPGVGPVTAQKIIAGRPYGSLDELVSKKAMGQSLYTKIKDSITY
ncbi:hypothetical protein A2Z00_05620 [Candidatus Gottesmanbacteria bacterium RBG_13_45_10]|uniref:Soluble ligand binding domain-containing protein n=1 Tax=Candidatus Gottesmanbacteria bacterium RBG_13_45_10 TaxID=1798370 RepID=A0A1F5ZGJ5_9BACT|nr:MAG: hypothetical protein A2Z00_05620 [Candidatus Gottesmanbacteria bacterium RBG_13_45_10]